MAHQLFTISLVCVLINSILCDSNWRSIGITKRRVISAADIAAKRIGGAFIEALYPAYEKVLSSTQYLYRVWFRANFRDVVGIRRCWAEVHWNFTDTGLVRKLNEYFCTPPWRRVD